MVYSNNVEVWWWPKQRCWTKIFLRLRQDVHFIKQSYCSDFIYGLLILIAVIMIVRVYEFQRDIGVNYIKQLLTTKLGNPLQCRLIFTSFTKTNIVPLLIEINLYIWSVKVTAVPLTWQQLLPHLDFCISMTKLCTIQPLARPMKALTLRVSGSGICQPLFHMVYYLVKLSMKWIKSLFIFRLLQALLCYLSQDVLG